MDEYGVQSKRVELDEWLARNGVMLMLDCEKRNKLRNPNSVGRFLITGENCDRWCGHNNFDVVAPRGNPKFFLIVTVTEGISLMACPGSQELSYYPVAVKRTPASTLYMKSGLSTISMFVGHRSLQHEGS